MKMNEWFHARIVIEGKTLRAYVDDDPQPVLVVDPMLGQGATGKIGLWGWNSHFRNFSFQPASAKE